MEVEVFGYYDALSRAAAKIFIDAIKKDHHITLGLATGSTPEGLYRELVKSNRKKEISFKNVTTFNLDEYVGLKPEHPQSYHRAMEKNLFSRIDIKKEDAHVPEGNARDLDLACRSYEKMIKQAGGIDLQLLGLGSNGHIGFNEPGSDPKSRVRVVSLDEQTIRDNSRNFSSEKGVPRRALTMGVATIMEARQIVLIASGKHKARAAADAIEGPVSSLCPASFLQKHRHCTILLDKPAAMMLKRQY